MKTEEKRRAAAGIPILPLAVKPNATSGRFERAARGWSYRSVFKGPFKAEIYIIPAYFGQTTIQPAYTGSTRLEP